MTSLWPCHTGRRCLPGGLSAVLATAFVLAGPVVEAGDIPGAELRNPARGTFDLSALTDLTAASLAQADAPEEEAEIFKGWSFGGHVDTAFVYNTNQPDSRQNATRIFDTRHSDFSLHQAQIVIGRAPTEEMPVGLELKFTAGEDAAGIHAAGLADGDIDVTSAHVQVLVPGDITGLSGGTIKIGKFETTIGYEVISSPDNWNYSRSLLFGLAIPFTHTGILYSNEIDVEGTVLGYNLGLVNGWDNVTDNNTMKSPMAGFSVTPIDWFSVAVNGIIGPETANNESDYQGVIDLTSTVTVPDTGLSIGLNVDYGASEVSTATDNYQKWYGIAGYTKFDFASVDTDSVLDRCYVALRAEVFRDPEMQRVGLAPAERFFEVTTTFGWRPFERFDDFLVRFEHRYDNADEKVFQKGGTAGARNHQNTLAVNTVLTF